MRDNRNKLQPHYVKLIIKKSFAIYFKVKQSSISNDLKLDSLSWFNGLLRGSSLKDCCKRNETIFVWLQWKKKLVFNLRLVDKCMSVWFHATRLGPVKENCLSWFKSRTYLKKKNVHFLKWPKMSNTTIAKKGIRQSPLHQNKTQEISIVTNSDRSRTLLIISNCVQMAKVWSRIGVSLRYQLGGGGEGRFRLLLFNPLSA